MKFEVSPEPATRNLQPVTCDLRRSDELCQVAMVRSCFAEYNDRAKLSA